MKKNKKPVVLITGYLGSGKTTLLNNLLKQEKRKVALIVHQRRCRNLEKERFERHRMPDVRIAKRLHLLHLAR